MFCGSVRLAVICSSDTVDVVSSPNSMFSMSPKSYSSDRKKQLTESTLALSFPFIVLPNDTVSGHFIPPVSMSYTLPTHMAPVSFGYHAIHQPEMSHVAQRFNDHSAQRVR